MAKKTMYHTGLTIGRIKHILKITEELERKLAETDLAPNMIMIHYDGEKKVVIIHEDFLTGKGKNQKFDHRNTVEVSSLQDYMFSPSFYGQILIDLMDLPTGAGNLFSVNAGLLRAEHGLLKKSFSLDFEGKESEESMTSVFNIIVYDDE